MPELNETDLTALESAVERHMDRTNKPMIGSRPTRNLTGASPAAEELRRSPCSQMKWLNDNTPWQWEAVVRVTHNSGHQGLRAIEPETGRVVKQVMIEIRGGDDGDVYRQVPINHRNLLRFVIAKVWERINR